MAAGLEAGAERWQAGADGERAVAKALADLNLPDVVVLHDRLLKPGSKVNLDHLVVGPMRVGNVRYHPWPRHGPP